MRFSCDSCHAQYMISDEKVGPGGVKVRCKKCGHIIPVKRAPAAAPAIEAAPAAAAAAGPSAPAAVAAGESTLETELGTAFQNVFGGGSAAVAAERTAVMPGLSEPAPQQANTASNVPLDAAASVAHDPAQNPVVTAEAFSDWYVALDEDQIGPIPAAGVKARWEAGEVGPDTLAWRPGMADWMAISGIPEMAQYLAPVARGSAKVVLAPPSGDTAAAAAPPVGAPHASAANDEVGEVPRAGPSRASAAPSGAGGLNGTAKDAEWKPAAASALAALASEEMAALAKPERKQAAAPAASGAAAGGSSLLERMDLPDGGVDPTNVVPLPIKGLEPTGEAALRTKAPPPSESTQIRELKKSTRRNALYIGIAMLVLFAAGIAVVVAMMRPSREAPRVAVAPEVAPAPVTAAPSAPTAAPAPAQNPPAPVAAAPSPSPSTSPSTSPSIPGTPEAAAAAAPPPAAAPAAAPPGEPERVAAAPQGEPTQRSEPPRRRRPEPPPRATEKPKRGSRLARAQESAPQPPPVQAPPQQASPAPAPPPARSAPAGDPDDEIDKILSGSGGSASAAGPAANGNGTARKRSVYVPPAIGSDIPENVSVSQINEAVLGQKPGLMRCIEQQKAADPDTRGTLKLRWVIAGDGGVRDVRVLSDEFAKQPIASCISSIVRGLHFPRSRTTGQEVVFPFKF